MVKLLRVALRRRFVASLWVVIALFVWQASCQGNRAWAQPVPARSAAPAVAAHSDDAPFDTAALLRLARKHLNALHGSTPEPLFSEQDASQRNVVFLSLLRPTQAALIGIGEGATVEAATLWAVDDLRSQATFADLAHGRLKIDVAVGLRRLDESADSAGARVLPIPENMELAEHDFLFSPQELAALNLRKLPTDDITPDTRFYLSSQWQRPANAGKTPAPADSAPASLTYQSRIETVDGDSVELHRGNRLLQEPTPEALLQSAKAGGDYLLRRLRLNGEFDYCYDPRTNQSVGGYNLLRHAGTCYALLELQQVLNQEASLPCAPDRREIYREGAQRGIAYLVAHHTRRPKVQDQESNFLAIVSPGEEAKLGGAALTLLAMLKHHEILGDDRWLAEMQQLASFLVFQQEPDGQFRSKYFYGTPDHEPFDSLYYPGEAILALTRLAKIAPEGPWLATAKRGADWLIDVRDADKPVADLPHDHWLLMGLNELTALTDDPRYVTHARKIADSICRAHRQKMPKTGWIGTAHLPPRATPTSAEALVAMARLARRHRLDDRDYMESLQAMAAVQLQSQITLENGMYLPRPDQAIGGFRPNFEDWEIRIDQVQHNMSALLGLRSLLLEQPQ